MTETENEVDAVSIENDFPAPLPTREISRRKSLSQLNNNNHRRRKSQESLDSFTGEESVSSDPGRIVEVGNIRFLNDDDMPVGETSILGRGAFATVRLARRRLLERNSSMISGLSEQSDCICEDHSHLRRQSKSFIRTKKKTNEESSSSSDGKKIGDGGGKLVAVKIFEKSLLEKCKTMEFRDDENNIQVRTALENVEREIAVMKMMQHPNLVSLYEVIDTGSNRLYMVLEYLPLGEIMTNVQGSGRYKRRPLRNGEKKLEGVTHEGYFDETHAALYFVDIMHGLAHLHKNHVVHRDLKPENILLDSRGFCKISDFGVAHLFEDEMQTGRSTLEPGLDAMDESAASAHLSRRESEFAASMKSMSDLGKLTKTEGTWCFWSPEMCAEDSLVFSGYACDIWAAGICLHIFATGILPFYSEIPLALFDMIAEANIKLDGFKLSKDLIDLLKRVLAKDPKERAGVGDCLNHPFCKEARNKRIWLLGEGVEKHEEVVVTNSDMRHSLSKAKSNYSIHNLASNVSKRILYFKSRLGSSSQGASMCTEASKEEPSHKKRVTMPNIWTQQKTMSMDKEDGGGDSSATTSKKVGLVWPFKWKSTGQI